MSSTPSVAAMHVGSASAARVAEGYARVHRHGSEVAEHATLPALFARQAALTPSAPAVLCGDRVMTYHELERAANRLAHALVARKLPPTTRIAVLLDRSIEMVVALLAILKSGNSYVPLDPA